MSFFKSVLVEAVAATCLNKKGRGGQI